MILILVLTLRPSPALSDNKLPGIFNGYGKSISARRD